MPVQTTVRSLKGIIDMHVHTAPDIRRRRFDDFQLCDVAVQAGARAIVLKNHHGSTAERAFLVNRYNANVHGENGFTMYGSIVLDTCIGGVNPEAVEYALKLGAKIVWLPTQAAVNHHLKYGKDLQNTVEVVRDGKLVENMIRIFELVKEYDAVLGTGHLSADETFRVVEEARYHQVEKIIVPHPEWWVTRLTIEQQITLAKDYGVVLERCYAQNVGSAGNNTFRYEKNLASNVEVIKEVGYEHVLVSTDGGQIENPPWDEAEREYQQYMADHGIPEEHIAYMTRTLPARLLGIS